jgi:AcrR family transcriptional regulator
MKKTYDQKIILKAAISLAKKNGLKKLTMRKLAFELNCSVMPIYDNYESKDMLIKDVFDEIVRENNKASTYFERNLQVLLNGIKSPQLFRDVKEYSPVSSELMNHYKDTINLMAKEDRLKKFDNKAHQSIHFDLLIYISGLVDRQLYLSEDQKEADEFWIGVFEGFTEVLLLGYEKARELGKI